MITNDRGQSVSDPCEYFCGREDLASWGRVLLSFAEQAEALESEGRASEALKSWIPEARKKADATATPGLGFDALAIWGNAFNSEIVADLIREIQDGRRLIAASGSKDLPGSVKQNEEDRQKEGFQDSMTWIGIAGALAAGFFLARRVD